MITTLPETLRPPCSIGPTSSVSTASQWQLPGDQACNKCSSRDIPNLTNSHSLAKDPRPRVPVTVLRPLVLAHVFSAGFDVLVLGCLFSLVEMFPADTALSKVALSRGTSPMLLMMGCVPSVPCMRTVHSSSHSRHFSVPDYGGLHTAPVSPRTSYINIWSHQT